MKKILLLLIPLLFLCACSKEIQLSNEDIIEENLYPTGRSIQINSDEFDKYFVLKNESGERIPILLRLTLNFKETSEEESLLQDSIESMEVKFYGIDSFQSNDLLENSEFEFTRSFVGLYGSDNTLVVDAEDEGAIAFLKKEFQDKIKVKSFDENYIKYTADRTITSNCLIYIRRDPQGIFHLIVQ